MKKGIEIIKQVNYTADKEVAKKYNIEYSEEYVFMQVIVDHRKKKIGIYLKTVSNDVHHVTVPLKK